MYILFYKMISIFLLFSMLVACSDQSHLPHPSIKSGRVKVSGKIVDHIDHREDVYVYLTIPHPITGENAQYKTKLDSTGNFLFEVDLETNLSLGSIYSDVNLFNSLLFSLEDGNDVDLKVTYDAQGYIENMELNGYSYLSDYDALNGLETMDKMINYRSGRPRERLYEKDKTWFLNYVDTILNDRLNIANNDSLLSEKMRGYLHREIKIFLYDTHVLDYETEMRQNYRNTNNRRAPDSLKIQRPTKQYYRFLRKLDLNDPQYLYSYSFPEFVEDILQNEILDIPHVLDTPIDVWLQQVKAILSDLLGFDKGLFYDILISNAYSSQFKNELKPLSDMQIKNIKDHFKGNEIEKILLNKNKEIIDFNKKRIETVINETPKVNSEELMDTIVSKYKNKVVLVDLWATWCGPCLSAIRNFAETKNTFKEKNVIFIYITNPSSPYKLWQAKSEGIGGEHYYLSSEQWNYIMNQFKFRGIPSYLLYNKQGVLQEKMTGSPGPDEMEIMITNILNKE